VNPDLRGFNGKTSYYSESDILDIIKAKQERAPVPSYPGLTYLKDALKILHLSEKTLRRLAARHEPPVPFEEKPGRSKDGRGLPLVYTPTWFVDELKAERFAKLTEDEVTVDGAAALLECSRSQVHALIQDDLLTRFPRKLAKVYKQRRRGRETLNRGVRRGFTLSRAEVIKLRADGVWPPRPPDLDPGVWKDLREIAEARQVPDWRARCLLCQWLKQARESDPTVAQRIWYTNRNGNWRRKWKYNVERLGALPAGAISVRGGPDQSSGRNKYPRHVKKPQSTGPTRDPDREAILEYCYDGRMIQGLTRREVFEDLRELFPESPHLPKGHDDVKRLVKAWAYRHEPPLPLDPKVAREKFQTVPLSPQF
jgi:hypothetical protein